MKIVIIEDEKITAKDLQNTLQSIDNNIEIVAMLHSVEDGVHFFNKLQTYDLIFSDIQLGDGLSFDIFNQIQNNKPIIFCTAFNEYALQAFSTVGIDYILKPFSKESVTKALSKYISFKEQFSTNKGNYNDLLYLLNEKLQGKTGSVIIRQADKIIPLDTNEIALFYFENGYSFAYTFKQQTHILSKTLEELEQNFSPLFFRANRQFLVNRKAIKDVSNVFNRKMIINLSIPFKDEIIVGKLKTTALIDWLANN